MNSPPLVTLAKEPHIPSKEPYIPSKEPYIPSKEPCIVSKEPYILSKEPLYIHTYYTYFSYRVATMSRLINS